MKATPLAIPEVMLIEPKVFGDDRGFFLESFNQQAFNQACWLKLSRKKPRSSPKTLGSISITSGMARGCLHACAFSLRICSRYWP